MRMSVVLIMLVAAGFTAAAADAAPPGHALEPARSVFSVDVGYASDGDDARGYSGFMKSATFLDDGPLYYGFGSLFGSFVSTAEAFFETGLLVGYNRNLGDSGLDVDAFLDLLITGGRINQETSSYRAEAPALHVGLSLGFFALADVDGAIFVAPVIRPYNLQDRTWDFSRSYMTLGVSLRLKSYALVEQRPWSESITAATTSGGNL